MNYAVTLDNATSNTQSKQFNQTLNNPSLMNLYEEFDGASSQAKIFEDDDTDDEMKSDPTPKDEIYLLNFTHYNQFSYKLALKLEIPKESVKFNLEICKKELKRPDLAQIWTLVGVALKRVESSEINKFMY